MTGFLQLANVLPLLAVAGSVAALLAPRPWAVAASSVLVVSAVLCGGHGVPWTELDDGVQSVLFVAGMVIVAAAADRSGLLGVLADRLGRGVRRPEVALLAVFSGAVVVTSLANLDTTAVLFTPLALRVAASADLPLAPFALAPLLAANFGSMLLPSANLTNFVVWRASDLSFAGFAQLMFGPFVLAVGLTAAALLIGLRVARGRAGRGAPVAAAVAAGRASPTAERPLDRPLVFLTVGLLALLAVAFQVGLPVAGTTVAAALLLVGWRRSLWRDRVSTGLVVALLGLFVAAGCLARAPMLDGGEALAPLGAAGGVPLGIIGAAAANIGTNLVAVLVLRSAATSHAALRMLLIGVNLGAGLLPLGSLATVLWIDSLRRHGLWVPWRWFIAVSGGLAVVLVLAGSVLFGGGGSGGFGTDAPVHQSGSIVGLSSGSVSSSGSA